MKKFFAFIAAAILSVGSTQAVIVFNPANPLFVDDEGGFTGTSTVGSNPYSQARLVFSFSSLNPDPLPASFQITNILLKGPGITSTLSFSPVTITGNGFALSGFVNLNSTLLSVDLSSALVSFDLPGGSVINDGAELSAFLRYASANEFNVLTSATGPIFAAEAPAAVPEPGTWAAAALLAGGAAFMRWRKRDKSS